MKHFNFRFNFSMDRFIALIACLILIFILFNHVARMMQDYVRNRKVSNALTMLLLDVFILVAIILGLKYALS